ncbi:MAG: tetratricopeptide repeat protein [Bryobacteraceae bacterium]
MVLLCFPWTPLRAANDQTAQLRRARQAAHTGDWKTAEEAFRLYRQANPDSIEATVLHAEALGHVSQPCDGILELESLLTTHPDAVPALKLYGDLLDRIAHDWPRAEKAWLHASEVTRGDPDVWRLMADLYLQEDKADKAADCYERTVKLAPDDPLMIAGLAYSHSRQGKTTEAEAGFQRALNANDRLNSPDGRVYALYGHYLLHTSEAAKSLPFFTRAIKCGSAGRRCTMSARSHTKN